MSFRRSTTLHVPVDVRRLWSVLATTRELNRLAGKPRGIQQPQDEARSVPALPFVMRRGGISMAWREEPYDFVRHRRLRGGAQFEGKGPLREYLLTLGFTPAGDGTDVEVVCAGETGPAPLGWLGQLILRQTFRETTRAVREIAARLVEGRVVDPLSAVPVGGDAAVRDRMQRALATIAPADDEERRILARLVDEVAGGSDSAVARLRPFALARAWGTDRERTLATMLHAARAGALVLHWDLVCPDCRRPPRQAARLGEVAGTQHCDTCAITFGVTLDEHVEVTFRPSPTVRTVDDHVWCFTDPARQEHVVAQAILDGGGRWEVELDLAPGLHRLRARRTRGSLVVEARPDGPAELAVTLDPAATREEPLVVRCGGAQLTVTLGGDTLRLVLLEQTAWRDDAARAAEVTALQAFRSLFPSEAVAAGEQVAVRRLAFLFTDLKDSTALYERVGDGPAYGAVSSHFRVLEQSIAAESGGVVKTIGDAVMAVFPDAAHATRAAVRMQRDLAAWNAERPEAGRLVLKIGLHEGPCVAVGANGALDYFGSTVNVAARVQALSTGGDLVLATALAEDPAIAAVLDGRPRDRFAAALKGVAREVEVTRVRLVD